MGSAAYLGLTTLLAVLLCLQGWTLPAGAQVSLNDSPSHKLNQEARAMQLLQQMVAAYSRLSSLEQRTEFYSSFAPLTPSKADKAAPTPAEGEQGTTLDPPNADPDHEKKLDLSLHLAFLKPNHLLLETQDVDASNKPLSSRWVSDGKTFWSYLSDQNMFTQERAPGNIRDFAHLKHLNSGCLEMLMLMGINPFPELKEDVDSIQYEGSEIVRGVETDVVAIRATQPTEHIELRLYIGKADALLRRLAIERTPILKNASGTGVKVGDALDQLAEDLQAPQPAQPTDPLPGDPVQSDMPKPDNPTPLPATPVGPVKTRLVYDNTLRTDALFAPQLFVFTPPPTAKLYQPVGATPQMDPRSRSLLSMIKKVKTHKVKAPREVNP